MRSRRSAVSAEAGSGMCPSIGVTSSRLVPQVTIGAISPASSVTSRSNSASGSVTMPDQRSTAFVPGLPGRRIGAAEDVGVGRLVRSDHACTGAGFDRHVADREPPFHREPAYRRAGILDDMADGACRADPANDRQDDVLGGDAEARRAVDGDAHRLRLPLPERLRRQHLGGLRHADTEGEGAERAMRRGVAVGADDRHAGLADPLLGADDVHDALAAGR